MYTDCLIELSNYLDSFLEKIGRTELNEIMLNSMPNSWRKRAYEQGFDCESIPLKKAVNMFERMEIVQYIYKGILEPYYNKTTREGGKHSGNSRLKRGEYDSPNNYHEMSESSGKCRKVYVVYPKGRSKPTYLIHGSGYSSDECKVLVYFGSKYAKSIPTKEFEYYPTNINKFNSQKKNNAIVNSVVDEILLHEIKK